MTNEITIVLTAQQLGYLRQVLGARPHDEVRQLVDEILRQVQAQQAARPEGE